MFSEMIASLKKGEMPSVENLRTKLQPAMVKKSGVLQQPRMCRSNDPKINPDSIHMLWAAILLGDQELIDVVAGMIFVEQENDLDGLTSEKDREMVLEKISGLLALAPNSDFKNVLIEKINEAVGDFCRK